MSLVALVSAPVQPKVHHASLDRLETLCGVDCAEFLFIEKTPPQDAVEDPKLCMKCSTKLIREHVK